VTKRTAAPTPRQAGAAPPGRRRDPPHRPAFLIRQRRPHLPILLATGYSEAAREAGRDFIILHKPYAMHELSQSIAKVIAAAG